MRKTASWFFIIILAAMGCTSNSSTQNRSDASATVPDEIEVGFTTGEDKERWVPVSREKVPATTTRTVSNELADQTTPEPWKSKTIGEITEYTEIYHFGKNDWLQVDVKGESMFSGVFQVEEDGMIKLPEHPNRIRVEGASEEQLRQRVVDELKIYYHKEAMPVVRVALKKSDSRRYYIFGEEMPQQGSFALGKTNITFFDAMMRACTSTLAESKGFDVDKRSAALTRVHVVTPHPVKPTCRIVNFYEMYHNGKMQNNFNIKPNDIIVVPDTLITSFNKRLESIFKWARTIRKYDEETLSHDDYLRYRLNAKPRGNRAY